MNEIGEVMESEHGQRRDDGNLVTIEVNGKGVKLEGPRVTGLQVKEAAIEQGVDIQLDFVLSHVIGEGGRRTVIVGNDDPVTIHQGSKFLAVPNDDNSEGSTPGVSVTVAQAVQELKEAYPDTAVTAVPDGEGGAYVMVESAGLTDIYNQNETWIGARVTFQYPFCDVYPLFVRGDLTRKDGAVLGEAMSTGHQFQGRQAVQVSRRSSHWNAAVDTAALKYLKTLQWICSRR